MKKIQCSHQDFCELFTVEVDNDKMRFTSVGKNGAGQYVLINSSDFNIGNASSSAEDYFLLTAEEVKEYAAIARSNGHISKRDYNSYREL